MGIPTHWNVLRKKFPVLIEEIAHRLNPHIGEEKAEKWEQEMKSEFMNEEGELKPFLADSEPRGMWDLMESRLEEMKEFALEDPEELVRF
ncbi:uncharacterized protein JCM6883_005840 [Sporobolomyces salmoneus]|uniref:uncharacterized protein n=1 Tax=Sporobolomyces salmoneus TaxID=183962 RepID=UPI00317FBF0D